MPGCAAPSPNPASTMSPRVAPPPQPHFRAPPPPQQPPMLPPPPLPPPRPPPQQPPMLPPPPLPPPRPHQTYVLRLRARTVRRHRRRLYHARQRRGRAPHLRHPQRWPEQHPTRQVHCGLPRGAEQGPAHPGPLPLENPLHPAALLPRALPSPRRPLTHPQRPLTHPLPPPRASTGAGVWGCEGVGTKRRAPCDLDPAHARRTGAG